ncbi:hypothetical protein NXS19_007022 [Fusarium pseudograminearum]|nr:hypothetical protein NXS19_007022 [Fusarium pseudograminearum]
MSSPNSSRRSSASSASSEDWHGRMHGGHKVCCERCYDGHRTRSKCDPTHSGMLIVLGKRSGRPKGAARGTATIPALILRDGTFLPETKVKVGHTKRKDKELRDRRVALHYKEGARKRSSQGQGLGMQPMTQGNGFSQENPNMFLNQTWGFQQPGPVSGGMANFQVDAMPMPANAMSYNMANLFPQSNQQILATVDHVVPSVAPAFAPAPTPGFGLPASLPLRSHNHPQHQGFLTNQQNPAQGANADNYDFVSLDMSLLDSPQFWKNWAQENPDPFVLEMAARFA